jgi:hypothetical protein
MTRAQKIVSRNVRADRYQLKQQEIYQRIKVKTNGLNLACTLEALTVSSLLPFSKKAPDLSFYFFQKVVYIHIIISFYSIKILKSIRL